MLSIPATGFYVYTLARPDGSVFYVGKGRGTRIDFHEKQARRGHLSHKCNTIRQIWAGGGAVQKQIVFTTPDEAAALAFEVALIATFPPGALTNLTRGGDGVAGYQFTPEGRARISAANKGRKPTALANQHVSEALQGHVHSPDTRAKLAAKAQARATTPEGRAHLLRSSEQARTPEARAKIGAARRVWYTDPAVLAQHRAARRVFTPEQIAAIRARAATGETQVALARAFRCGQTTIGHIVRRETYVD